MSHGASCAVDDMKKMEVLTILRSESSRVGVGGIMTTRHLAARNEPEREVRSCMDAAQRGANVHARDKTRLKGCQTPFDVASTKEVMELLREHELSEPKKYLIIQDNDHDTPLYLSADQGKLAAAQLLLRVGWCNCSLTEQAWPDACRFLALELFTA